MKLNFPRKSPHIAAALAALLALPLAQAVNMSRDDYAAAKTRITAEYKIDATHCAGLAGNAKDVCGEEAKGTEKTALADLEYNYTGKPQDRNHAQVVRADTAFAIAKEKCALKAGNDNDVCLQEARAVQTKSMADIKLGKQVDAARMDNASDKRDADYKVAMDKCDAVAGDAKANCVAAAKLRFDKS